MATCLFKTLLPAITKLQFHLSFSKNPQQLTGRAPITFLTQQKNMASAPINRDLGYEQVVELTKKKEIILIDVRENKEIQETGKLPGSVHIPLGEVRNALESLSPDEFKAKYGIDKPGADANLVFSCYAGKRSNMAMEAAIVMGYNNARQYAGGFRDWQAHNPAAESK